MINCIILNGPPNSGKDSIGRIIQEKFSGTAMYKFAKPLNNAFESFFAVIPGLEKFVRAMHEETKDDPIFPNKLGCPLTTPRQAKIALSEGWAKPLFGDDIFAMLLSYQLNAANKLNVVTDGGFVEEIRALAGLYPRHRILVVRVHRPGCEFVTQRVTDSRKYLQKDDMDNLGVKSIDFNNDLDLEFLEARVVKLVKEVLDGRYDHKSR